MDKTVIAIYLRLSNEDKNKGQSEESNSIFAQRQLITAHIQELMLGQPYEIAEFCDDGYSGTDFNRPGVQALLEAARNGEISMVIVKDFSRFGRDYLEVGRYLEYIFPILQVRFVSVNDNYDSSDKFGTTGGMSVALKNLVYGMYSADLSKKIRSARDTRVRNGEFVAAFAPYGYIKDPDDKHKLLVDDNVAWVVRRIFQMAADGVSFAEITRQLNDEGIPSMAMYRIQKNDGYGNRHPHVKVMLWSASSIRDMLTDEVYLGRLLWNRTKCGMDTGKKIVAQERENWIIVDNHHEPLVSQELFDKASCRVSHDGVKGKRMKRRNSFFICGHCGKVMQLRVKSRNRYYCNSRTQQRENACQKANIWQEDLENAVLCQVRNMANVMMEQRTARKDSGRDERKAVLEKLIADSEREMQQWKNTKLSLYEQYKAGSLSREEYIGKIERGKKRLEELEGIKNNALEELERLRSISDETGICDADLQEISALDNFELDRLRLLIEKVIVYGEDEIEIVWKVDDPFRNG
jgi:Site-specific recombinases, DNA invertase Pin homologs